MAYMNQEKKAIINKLMQPILKKYKVKATLSVDMQSIHLNIKSGSFDFVGIYNKYCSKKLALEFPHETFTPCSSFSISEGDFSHGFIHDHFNGLELDFIKEAFSALQGAGYYDNSDSQIDCFNVAYYFSINVGNGLKPYELIK